MVKDLVFGKVGKVFLRSSTIRSNHYFFCTASPVERALYRHLFARWVFYHDPNVNQEKLFTEKPVPIPIKTGILVESNRFRCGPFRCGPE